MNWLDMILRIVTFGIYEGKKAKEAKDAADRAEAQAINAEVHQPLKGERRDG